MNQEPEPKSVLFTKEVRDQHEGLAGLQIHAKASLPGSTISAAELATVVTVLEKKGIC